MEKSEIKKETSTINLATNVKEFINLLKSLDEKHQMGLYLITEGLQMIKK